MVEPTNQSDESHVLTMLPRRTLGDFAFWDNDTKYIDDAKGLCSCGWTNSKAHTTDEVADQHKAHCELMAAVA